MQETTERTPPPPALGVHKWGTLVAGTALLVSGFLILILLCTCQRDHPSRPHRVLQVMGGFKEDINMNLAPFIAKTLFICTFKYICIM